MRQVDAFASSGRFWRGNLHTHSTASDGHLAPAAVCELYRAAGYDFLAITDHFLERNGYPLTDASVHDTTAFITLRGAELHAGQIESGESWHLLGIGLPTDFAPPSEDETGPQLAKRALAAGSFVAALHPAWYGATEAEIRSLGPIHAIEVWNATAADLNDRPDSWYVLDQLLSRGGRHFALASDDAHFTGERNDALQAWIWVKAEALTPAGLLVALKAGHFYSSTGPEFRSIDVDAARRLRISCSPVERVFVTGRGSHVASVQGNELTEAVVDLADLDGPYCRVTVRDRDRRRAWSNPIWLDDPAFGR
ncbi:MAG: PHP domain-containing protein [Acidimicrobiales bacterium]